MNGSGQPCASELRKETDFQQSCQDQIVSCVELCVCVYVFSLSGWYIHVIPLANFCFDYLSLQSIPETRNGRTRYR